VYPAEYVIAVPHTADWSARSCGYTAQAQACERHNGKRCRDDQRAPHAQAPAHAHTPKHHHSARTNIAHNTETDTPPQQPGHASSTTRHHSTDTDTARLSATRHATHH
jgi:hypothetical protein